ncbi:MAG: DUF1697 domain-containing protein [Solirubrobacteraceae bacterium]
MRQILMLRGINLGSKRRVPMADLRALFTDAGYADVATYLQSGNVALSSSAPAIEVEREGARLISGHFGFDVPVVVRTRTQLARVVKHDPHGSVVDNPKLYQVSFRAEKLDAATAERLLGLATDAEHVAVQGREVYCWHAGGVARSKLWNALGGKGLGVTATTRNWTTVLALLAMSEDG